MSTDRDTHFAHWATLLFEELKPDLTLLLVELSRGNTEAVEKAERIIQQGLARRGYDLVFQHALVYLREGADIPDMTEWPVERDEESCHTSL